MAICNVINSKIESLQIVNPGGGRLNYQNGSLITFFHSVLRTG